MINGNDQILSAGRSSREVYFNPPQQKVMFTAANKTVFVGGRRLGKTHGIAAPWTLRNVQRMPKSAGAFVGSSFQQLLTRTLPGTLTALESFGYKRNVHFYVGRRPPKSAGFPVPYIDPECYDHVISFYTGSIAHLISQDREGTSNSFTLDWLGMDEAKLLNFDRLKEETFPANGGYKGHFGHIPWHHSELIISDMPTTKKGSWFLNYKDHCDNELIAAIQGLVFEIWRLEDKCRQLIGAGKSIPSYLPGHIKMLNKRLNRFRAIATYYEEFSSIQNLLVLGENYIRKMKRDLPPLVFQTSILCKRIGVLTDGFYSAMRENVHYYSSFDYSYLDGLDYNFSAIADAQCRQDKDLLPNEPTCIGMDYNANINWIVSGQAVGRDARIQKSFFVKYDRKIREVVQEYCAYYYYKPLKHVVYYYDTTALGSNYAVNEEDFASIVISEYERLGWTVTPVMIGNPLPHHEKHILINQGFKGQSGLIPRINKDNNEELILAMESTGVYVGTRGFQKDKRGEKLAESDEDKLEYRTDGTDAFDTLYIGMNKFPYVYGLGTGIASSMI